MQGERLSVADLDKSYAVPVLKSVSLSVTRGEILGLVGENGAGKTTLVNILTGMTGADAGAMFVDGIRYAPRDVRDALAAGIACVSQELCTVETLSVAENLALHALPAKVGRIDRRRLRKTAEELLTYVGLENVAADSPAARLSLAERQLLELAKALNGSCRVLILDEPTSALAAQQAERLHDILREKASQGTAIIYISHRLHDVLDVAGRVAVLRDGAVVAESNASETSVPELIRQMTGREPGTRRRSMRRPAQPADATGTERMTTRDLPEPLTLSCRHGEIVGLAGLAGAGRSELLQALFGLVPLTGGRRFRGGHRESEIENPAQAVRLGIGLVDEDRKATGIFAGQPVLTNVTLPGIRRHAGRWGTIDRAAEAVQGSRLIAELAIRCRGPAQDIAELSGGNQQKALLARWLHAGTEVFLLDEPTRGVDVGTKATIHALLDDLRAAGKALLVASSEIDELMAVCDRIVVLSKCRIVAEFQPPDWSEATILDAAFTGHLVERRTAAG